MSAATPRLSAKRHELLLARLGLVVGGGTAKDDQPSLEPAAQRGERVDEGRKVLLGGQATGTEDHRWRIGCEPGVIDRLGREPVQVGTDHGVVDGEDAWARNIGDSG